MSSRDAQIQQLGGKALERANLNHEEEEVNNMLTSGGGVPQSL